MSEQSVRYSIIIPTYNNWKVLSRVLPSVMAQAQDAGDVQVIVVDSSDDGTTDLIREAFPQIQLIHPPQRMLQGIARKLGAKNAVGDILIFLDGDCLPDCDWLTGFRLAQDWLASGIVCGAVDLAEPCDLSQFMEYIFWKLPENSSVPRGKYEFVIAENMMIRKEDFWKTKGFGELESFTDAVMDSARRQVGLGVMFEPTARVLHIHPRGWRRHWLKLFKTGVQSLAFLLLKEYRAGNWSAVLFPVVFLARWGRITWRVLIYRPRWIVRYLFIQPMLWVGLLSYQAGMWYGLWVKLSSQQQ